MYGTLSSVGVIPNNVAQNFGTDQIVAGIFVAPQLSATALEAQGAVSVLGTLSTANIIYTGNVIDSYTTPITATGEFLLVTVGDVKRAIRLWQYS